MIVVFNEESSFQAKDIISQTKGINVVIKDNIEGDINLSVNLFVVNNQESFTKYVVENAHKAEVRIFNAPSHQFVRTVEPIILGTYKNTYVLKMEYLLEPMGSNNQRVIKLTFTISKK